MKARPGTRVSIRFSQAEHRAIPASAESADPDKDAASTTSTRHTVTGLLPCPRNPPLAIPARSQSPRDDVSGKMIVHEIQWPLPTAPGRCNIPTVDPLTFARVVLSPLGVSCGVPYLRSTWDSRFYGRVAV